MKKFKEFLKRKLQSVNALLKELAIGSNYAFRH